MILGAAAVRFLLSSGGVTVVLASLGLWNLRRPKAPGARRAFVLAAVTYALLGYYPSSQRGADWLTSPFQPLTRADVPPGRVAVVLLGSGTDTQVDWSGNVFSVLDPIGAERTLEAARVFKLLDATWVVSSGGEPDPNDPDLPSSLTMQKALEQMGVPADRILTEQQSRTTRDEAVSVAAMLPSLGVNHVVLVTSGIHMRRSIAVFRSAGIDAIPAIARESLHSTMGMKRFLPSHTGLETSQSVLHEILGLVYYRLRGWQR